jgi:hypothetical protein
VTAERDLREYDNDGDFWPTPEEDEAEQRRDDERRARERLYGARSGLVDRIPTPEREAPAALERPGA